MKKLLSLVLAVMMLLAIGASAETVTELPRNETLYFGGQQWGTVVSQNPIGTNQNNEMACSTSTAGSRTIMFETLYMYNFLDGSMTGLLADGDAVWAEDQTSVTIKLKDAAKWSDGTPVTAEDVKATWDIDTYLMNGIGASYGAYIDRIEVVDEKTFTIFAKLNDAGQPTNPLKVKDFMVEAFIAQAAWIETLKTRCDGDVTAMLNDAAEDVVWSGPYTKYIYNDQQAVYVRDDNSGDRMSPCGAACPCRSTSLTPSTPTTPLPKLRSALVRSTSVRFSFPTSRTCGWLTSCPFPPTWKKLPTASA